MVELAFNELNHDYFELWTPSVFLRYLKNAGLDNFCDLALCHDLLASAHNILDVGAGYGRAIHYIQDHFENKSITAIERSGIMCRYLRETFSEGNVTVLEQDVFDYQSDKQFDCILFLWASICCFTYQEIIVLLRQLKDNLVNTGYMIIDIPVSANKKYANVINMGNYYHGEIAGKSIYCNIPTPHQLKCLTLKSGFAEHSSHFYTSSSGITRELFIIAKS